jgi:hypothetical protein
VPNAASCGPPAQQAQLKVEVVWRVVMSIVPVLPSWRFLMWFEQKS